MNILVLFVDDESGGRIVVVVVALAVDNMCLSATETAVASSFSAVAALGERGRRPGPAGGEKADPFSTQSASLP